MCGILAILGKADAEAAQQRAKIMNHRGPDERGMHLGANYALCHERLAIVDLKTGRQPIKGCGDVYVVHNGEIYNHTELHEKLLQGHVYHSASDSEVIAHLFEKFGSDFCNLLDGIFAFAVAGPDKFMAARDPLGVKPMYYGKDKDGSLYFASEMKVIFDIVHDVKPFPPGHYYTPETGLVQYYHPEWFDHTVCTDHLDLVALRDSLIAATEKRLMADAPLGTLLSGGLDSSLVSAIAQRLNGTPLHSFAVGLDPRAPDLVSARKVADFIGTKHHEVIYTAKEGFEALNEVIYHLETYDVTTIRAGTAMFFLSKAIQERGIKTVLSGEGSDELFGGYLYFHNAPCRDEFQKETIRRLQLLGTADLQRADRSTMAHGIEARVPFLDKSFLDLAVRIRPEEKMGKENEGIEKYIIRKAFHDPENPWIPDEILWRQKEQFSDGVGYGWIDYLVARTAEEVSDEEFAKAPLRFPYNTPQSKEAYYYRNIFTKHFPTPAAAETVKLWIPKWQENPDASGRASDHHSTNKAED